MHTFFFQLQPGVKAADKIPLNLITLKRTVIPLSAFGFRVFIKAQRGRLLPRPMRIRSYIRLYPRASDAAAASARQFSELNAKEVKLSKFLLISAKLQKGVRLKASRGFVQLLGVFGLTRVRSLFLHSLRSRLFHESPQLFLFSNICGSRTLTSCDTALTLPLARSHVLSQYLPLDLFFRF